MTRGRGGPGRAWLSGWRALDRRQRRVLAAMVACNALIFFDQTAVVVALPEIERDLGATPEQVRWTITAFLLPLAVFMVLAGRLADHLGRRRMLLAGMAVFGAGSAACALAPTIEALIATRALQGLGAALLAPLVLGNTTRVMPDARRGWAIGVLAAGGTTFLVLGPLIAAGVLQAGSWRWLFAIPLPVLAGAFAVARRWVTPSRESRPRSIDPVGVGLLLLGLGAAVVGVTQLQAWGAPAAGMLAGGLAALAVFVRRERRVPEPLIGVGLLRDRLLATSLAALFAIQFAVLGCSVHLVLFAEHGLGAGVVQAGLLVVAAGVFTASVGPFATLAGERRALAAGLVAESRQLGAVLGVAVVGAVVAAVGEAAPDAAPEAVAHGFRAGMLVAAGVTAAALVAVVAAMPARRRA